ncbi:MULTISPECIES: fumarylacetoacetate hydrolase family protein [unclassified Pseudonocardia]|uniref:fumarylacetoacetate hydrolase family protein n=1 Tax=unclassified Pseudonocardia TaxID=2619320 RepID=UPI000761D3A9|nr:MULTISPECIES: fumarylacetoacetate hydrolase family protein [unclassified Pseudonocardia]
MSTASGEFVDFTLVSFQHRGQEEFAAGMIHDRMVWPLADAHGVPDNVLQACLLAATPDGVDRLRSGVLGPESRSRPTPLDEVRLGSPLSSPEKIICLGLNYVDHATETGFEAPPAPIIFSKFRNSLVGPHDPVVLPRSSHEVDFEGELAVVIGRAAKYVDEADALAYVAGYAVTNDVTARDLQVRTSQWTAGKALDTFAPMGPGLVPAGLVPDPQDLMIETRVNSETMQYDSTKAMIFSVAHTIADLSTMMTLVPGDVIATGTPAGVGFKQDPPRFLTAGDVVEVSIRGIGTIRNPVVAEDDVRQPR